MPVRLLRRPGLLTKILLTISTDTKSTYPVCPEERCAPRPCFFPLIKASWGRDGGLGGKDYENAFSRFAAKRLGPPAPAATERRPQAVPVRRQRSLTGIDSRARGSPSPQTSTNHVEVFSIQKRSGCRPAKPLLEHFQFEMLRVPNHIACRFAEKTRFSAWFGPGGAVPPPRVLPFSKATRSNHTLLSLPLALSGWGVQSAFPVSSGGSASSEYRMSPAARRRRAQTPSPAQVAPVKLPS